MLGHLRPCSNVFYLAADYLNERTCVNHTFARNAMDMIDHPRVLQQVLALTGTPTYVYDLDGVEAQATIIRDAHAHNPVQLNFFEPTNRNVPVLQRICRAGLGITVTRQRGAERALQIGFLPEHIDCSGFALSDEELKFFVAKNIRVNLSSEWEIARCSRMFPGHPFGIRVDVTTDGREKRGVEPHSLPDLICESSLRLHGLHTYIGTGILSVAQHLRAAATLADIVMALPFTTGASIRYINVGGGFGYDYKTGQTFDWNRHAIGIRQIAEQLRKALGRAIEFRFEVGRGLVANQGILLARVLDAYEKAGRRYVVVDVSCSDLPRPIRMGFDKSFFPYMDDGCHRIDLVDPQTFRTDVGGTLEVAVVGNSHYSKDWIGLTHVTSFSPQQLRGALVIVRDVGAYCEVLRDNWTETRAARSAVLDQGELRESAPFMPAA